MQKSYRLLDNKVAACDPDQGEILVFVNPSEEERRYLTEVLLLDEHTLSSTMDPDELPRLEFEPSHQAMILKKPKNYSSEDDFLFRVTSMGFFLFRDRLVIVAPDEAALFEARIFNSVRSLHEVLLRLIYRNIFHYREHLKIVNMISDDLEHKINVSLENKFLINLFSLEKSLVYYLNALNSNAAVFERLKNSAAKIGLSPESVELLEDIIIENNQCFRQAEIYSNILAGLMDARASIVSNNLNVLMKTLNIVTIAIMVPTFVVSAFSMNVRIPMEDHPWAFWMVLGLALFSVMGFFLFWRYKKW